jgi:hypothetical protein
MARPVKGNEDSADEKDHDEKDEEVESVKLVDQEVRVACGGNRKGALCQWREWHLAQTLP